MQIDYAAITHPGRVRKNNEDSYLLDALDGSEPILNGPARAMRVGPAGFLAAVADGMGGAAAGEVASREGLAAAALNLFGHWGRSAHDKSTEADLVKAIQEAVTGASHAVLRYADEDRTSRGMGSTLTLCVVWNQCAYIAQIGDSRAYLFRKGTLRQLTQDQTLVQDMVNAGTLTLEQAKTHPHRNMITQALGSPQPLSVALSKVPLRRGDQLLICSDGLHGEVGDDGVAEVLSFNEAPARALEQLLEHAMTNGARDNVTGILLNLADPSLPSPDQEDPPQVLPPLAVKRPGILQKISAVFTRRA